MSAPPKKKSTGKTTAEKVETFGTAGLFAQLFRGQELYYGQMITDVKSKKGRRGWTASDGLTSQHWQNHLSGTEPWLGIVPIMNDGRCNFGVIDYDDHDADIKSIEKEVKRLELPLVVCRSQSGGVHLYVFLSEPVKALELRLKLQQWASLLKLENPDGRDIEIFPKQTKVSAKTQGNWIAIPYFGGDKDDTRYAIKDGKKLSLTAFLEHAKNTRLTRKEFQTFFVEIEDSRLGPDAPPCLQHLDSQGVGEGSRNNFLFNLGILYKQMAPRDWAEKLEAYNAEYITPPLSSKAVADTIRSLERKDYTYTCDEQPLSLVCYAEQCSLRKYGVVTLKSAKTGAVKGMPEITDLLKITTDPPMWAVMVDNVLVEGLETDDILVLNRFRRAVMNKANIVYPNVKLDVWLNTVRRLMNGVQEIEAPEDAGIIGMFKSYFHLFLDKYRRSTTREDVLKGNPFLEMPEGMDATNEALREKNGRLLFRATDLWKYLQQEHRFREYTQAQLYAVCRKLGAEPLEININRRSTKVWAIRYSFLDTNTQKFEGDKNAKSVDI